MGGVHDLWKMVARCFARNFNSGSAASSGSFFLVPFVGLHFEIGVQKTQVRSLWLDFDDDSWTRAANTARTCLRAGVNVPFGDILIHSCAARYKLKLFGRDRHFAMIRDAGGE